MRISKKVVAILAASLVVLACSKGSAKVRQSVSSPSGKHQAVLLFRDGGIHMGTRTFVAIFEGNAPPVDSMHEVRDLCVVWTAYRASPWKLTWEGEEQVGVAVDRQLSKDYESMVEQPVCSGIRSRWYYEARPVPPQ